MKEHILKVLSPFSSARSLARDRLKDMPDVNDLHALALRWITSDHFKAAEALYQALQTPPQLAWKTTDENGECEAETIFGTLTIYHDGAYGWLFDFDGAGHSFCRFPADLGEDFGYETLERAQRDLERQIFERAMSVIPDPSSCAGA